MRNPILTRLKTLLAAAIASLYTKRHTAAKPKYRLEPASAPTDDLETFLFDGAEATRQETARLSHEMGALADSLSGLRETLDLMTGVTPFPTQALTATPCSRLLPDSDLFDGEPAMTQPHQDTIVGGAADFLFEDDIQAEPVRHAA
ncbi:MAG: hypothetical protein AAGI14_01795 [Pseudomonadota bacterium]